MGNTIQVVNHLRIILKGTIQILYQYVTARRKLQLSFVINTFDAGRLHRIISCIPTDHTNPYNRGKWVRPVSGRNKSTSMVDGASSIVLEACLTCGIDTPRTIKRMRRTADTVLPVTM